MAVFLQNFERQKHYRRSLCIYERKCVYCYIDGFCCSLQMVFFLIDLSLEPSDWLNGGLFFFLPIFRLSIITRLKKSAAMIPSRFSINQINGIVRMMWFFSLSLTLSHFSRCLSTDVRNKLHCSFDYCMCILDEYEYVEKRYMYFDEFSSNGSCFDFTLEQFPFIKRIVKMVNFPSAYRIHTAKNHLKLVTRTRFNWIQFYEIEFIQLHAHPFNAVSFSV